MRATVTGRARAQEIDEHVGLRIRERRTLLGLRQQQMAERIGVSYQQVHKYESGIDRITAGRLASIAQALDVEVSYFFLGMDAGGEPSRPTLRQRMMLDLARDFIGMPRREHQEAICMVARALVDPEPAEQQP